MTDSLVDVIAEALAASTLENAHVAALDVLAAIEASGKVVIDQACEVEPSTYLHNGREDTPLDYWHVPHAPAGTTKVYVVSVSDA